MVGRAGKPGQPGQRPERLVTDWGYDSNRLRAALVQRGIEPISPARRNNPHATHQDGRKLRRYRRRWIIERTFAWLGHFRRLVVRYERLVATYSGFFHLAGAVLTLIRVLNLLQKLLLAWAYPFSQAAGGAFIRVSVSVSWSTNWAAVECGRPVRE